MSSVVRFVPCFFGENIELEMKLFSNDLSYVGTTVFRTPLRKGYTIDLSIEFDLNSSKINSSHTKKLNSLVELLSFNKNINLDEEIKPTISKFLKFMKNKYGEGFKCLKAL